MLRSNEMAQVVAFPNPTACTVPISSLDAQAWNACWWWRSILQDLDPSRYSNFICPFISDIAWGFPVCLQTLIEAPYWLSVTCFGRRSSLSIMVPYTIFGGYAQRLFASLLRSALRDSQDSWPQTCQHMSYLRLVACITLRHIDDQPLKLNCDRLHYRVVACCVPSGENASNIPYAGRQHEIHESVSLSCRNMTTFCDGWPRLDRRLFHIYSSCCTADSPFSQLIW